MRANTSLHGALGALIALASLWLCGEASALFIGFDESADETAAVGGTGTASSTDDTSTSSGARDTVVNPFDDGVRSTMPENTPGVAIRRSGSWGTRHRNAQRFENLLHGKQTPAAKVRPVETREAAPSGPPKRSCALDYVFGVVVVAGLGAIAVLLFRRHDPS